MEDAFLSRVLTHQMILLVPMLIADAMTIPVMVPHCTRVFRRPLQRGGAISAV